MKPKRIVVIDDCRMTLAMARVMLEDTAFEVLTAESGIEANAHIFGLQRPDALVGIIRNFLPEPCSSM